MAIAAGSTAGHTTLDEVRLRLRSVRHRITVLPAKSGIALAAVIDEGDRHTRLAAADSDIRNAVRRRAKVGMGAASAPDEVDVCIRLRIDRRGRNGLVPPVDRRKQLSAAEIFPYYARG